MRRIASVLAGLILALAMATSTFAATPDGKTAATAFPLSDKVVTGDLSGSKAGEHAYYTFDYAGDGKAGTITMSFSPADPATANGIGINVYQAGTKLASSNGKSKTPGTFSLSFSSKKAGPVLVHVYDYSLGPKVSYGLSVTGLSAPAATVAAPVAAAVPAVEPVALTKSVTGVLVGDRAGAFARHVVEYAGDGSTTTLNLYYDSKAPNIANAVQVSVYQDGKKIASSGSGAKQKTLGVLPVSFSSKSKSPALVVVENYGHGLTVGYTLTK